ncbi:MAG TPA: DUF952 domain-containing protein [Aestuariivirga sp.]|nr:DUF952 domain-containing protein [Aestuariivirga sp.]
MQLLFKICAASEWAGATMTGAFRGSAVDYSAGFIHLSAAHQVRETARKHFAGREELVLVALTQERLLGLKWERSRGGDLFPHVHGAIPVSAARWVEPLPLQGGVHVFPERFLG